MNIATIMSTTLPGSFAPDINASDASEAPTVSPIPGLAPLAGIAPAASSDATKAISSVSGETSFKDTLGQMLSNVNDALNTGDQNTRDLATGKTNDTTKVVTSVEEANLALQYTLAIRTKLLQAYQAISQMQM
jgi:flagellar hook-basal body complex protein FliE